MRVHIVSITLFSAALLCSCSSPWPAVSSMMPADVRPEVAQPLNEARRLAGFIRPDQSAIRIQLSQAESVPDLNRDERDQICIARAVALRSGCGPDRTTPGYKENDFRQSPDYPQTLGYTGLR